MNGIGTNTKIIIPGPRSGCFRPPVSKSDAHRLLIGASLSGSGTVPLDGEPSDDLLATVRCLRALGAAIREVRSETGRQLFFESSPARLQTDRDRPAELACGESGTTFRFLLPIAAAIGRDSVFRLSGRLPERPVADLAAALTANGAQIDRQGPLLFCSGRIRPGFYSVPGNVSSQFVSGLLFALPLLEGDSVLTVEGSPESAPYISMTEKVLSDCGIRLNKDISVSGIQYRIPGNQAYRAPDTAVPEADWSGAAPFFCIGACHASGVSADGLSESSLQGDRAILAILESFGARVLRSGKNIRVCRGRLNGIDVDASQIPDLVPALTALAAGAAGTTRILNASRLRQKESDRLKTTAAMLRAVGADILETGDGLTIRGKTVLAGGETDSFGDHRIAMAAAVAASFCTRPVTVLEAGCVSKSFPSFWTQFDRLEVFPL